MSERIMSYDMFDAVCDDIALLDRTVAYMSNEDMIEIIIRAVASGWSAGTLRTLVRDTLKPTGDADDIHEYILTMNNLRGMGQCVRRVRRSLDGIDAILDVAFSESCIKVRY